MPHVLIVDDEPEIRLLLLEYLTDLGFEATAVETGREAIDAVEMYAIDAVLLDWSLPGIPGREVLRKVGDLSPWSKVIVITGNLDEARRLVEAMVPNIEVLTKPFPLGLLAEALKRVLGSPGPDVQGETR